MAYFAAALTIVLASTVVGEAVLWQKSGRPGSRDGGVKKTIWFHEDEAEALRLKAFKDRRSESAIVRESLRRLLGIED